MTGTYVRYPPVSGGGGAVNSVNGLTGTVVLTTTEITEGTRLYYTQARFDAALAAKTTTNLAEGSNLYYTTARVNALLTAPGPIGSVTPNTGAFTSAVATAGLTVTGEITAAISATDMGALAGEFSASSHTTVDGSNTTLAFQTVADSVVDAGVTNDKAIAGGVFTVSRNSGTDDGAQDSMAGSQVLLTHNSGAAGVTNKAYGFAATEFMTKGTVNSLYDFYSIALPMGGTVLDYYGLYLDDAGPVGTNTNYGVYQKASGSKNFFNGSVGIGTATPATKLDIEGTLKIADGTEGAGKVLTSDAAGVATWQVAGGGTPHGQTVYNADDTFTVPAGVTRISVTIVGAGGGTGGAGGGGGGTALAGGSAGQTPNRGSNGTWTTYTNVPVTPAAMIAVVVGSGGDSGAGGAGGAANSDGIIGSDGLPGAASSFGNFTVPGGNGGGGGAPGTAGAGTGAAGATVTPTLQSGQAGIFLFPSDVGAGGAGGTGDIAGDGSGNAGDLPIMVTFGSDHNTVNLPDGIPFQIPDLANGAAGGDGTTGGAGSDGANGEDGNAPDPLAGSGAGGLIATAGAGGGGGLTPGAGGTGGTGGPGADGQVVVTW